MNRRSFITAFAGLPIVGVGARMFGRTKAKSGITVHGPELIVAHSAFDKQRPMLSLRFGNVPLPSGDVPMRDLVKRLQPLFGTINRSMLSRRGSRVLSRRLSYVQWMFTDFGVSPQENGLCSVLCAFTPAFLCRPYPGSHRPVDFETEILKALSA